MESIFSKEKKRGTYVILMSIENRKKTNRRVKKIRDQLYQFEFYHRLSYKEEIASSGSILVDWYA